MEDLLGGMDNARYKICESFRGDFHLSDELYIKMNSRGKPLSDFETFKARFESFLAKYSSEINDFSARIDGQWAGCFLNCAIIR